jgi:hypothetical protein
MSEMSVNMILHILRNPYGYSEKEQKQARLAAADKIEEFQDAYLNMRKFAEDNGLDTTCKRSRP